MSRAPERLSYSLVASPPPRGSALKHSLRIDVVYASGRVMSFRERFKSVKEAEHFIARFYPDLIGKCTGIETLPR